MAENKTMHVENLKKVNELIKNGNLEELIKSAGSFELEVKSFKKN